MSFRQKDFRTQTLHVAQGTCWTNKLISQDNICKKNNKVLQLQTWQRRTIIWTYKTQFCYVKLKQTPLPVLLQFRLTTASAICVPAREYLSPWSGVPVSLKLFQMALASATSWPMQDTLSTRTLSFVHSIRRKHFPVNIMVKYAAVAGKCEQQSEIF